MELRNLRVMSTRVREAGFELDVNEVVVQELGTRMDVDAVVDDSWLC